MAAPEAVRPGGQVKVVAIIQARMGGFRLPGKMLMPLHDRPVISWSIGRTKLANRVNLTVVATTVKQEDKVLVQWCRKNGVSVFCGDGNDVLDRLYRCALEYGATHVVRLTGDCPLIDPLIINTVIDMCIIDDDVAYASNVEPMTYPEGMSVEVMPLRTLEIAWRESYLPSHREHVTPFIRFHPERFKHSVLRADPDLSHLRLTVDYEDDLDMLSKLVQILGDRGLGFDFTLSEIVEVLDQDPTLKSLGVARQRDIWRQEVARDEGRTIV